MAEGCLGSAHVPTCGLRIRVLERSAFEYLNVQTYHGGEESDGGVAPELRRAAAVGRAVGQLGLQRLFDRFKHSKHEVI